MYVISLSDANVKKLLDNDIIINGIDTAWFITRDEKMAENVVDYFEKVDYNKYKSIMFEIMMHMNENEISRPLFKIVKIENVDEYRKYLLTFMRIDPSTDTSDITNFIPFDMIFIEGINNAYKNKKEQHKYQKEYFDKSLLKKIKHHFHNKYII